MIVVPILLLLALSVFDLPLVFVLPPVLGLGVVVLVVMQPEPRRVVHGTDE